MKLIPLILLALLCIVMGVGISSRKESGVSPMVGKIFPVLELEGAEAIARTEGVRMVNLFASWCIPCAVEHEQLMELAGKHGLPIIGIAWKNKPADVAAWVAQRGNPYRSIIIDQQGVSTLPLGISGVPENFIITGDGRIAYHTKEPITGAMLQGEILPLLRGMGVSFPRRRESSTTRDSEEKGLFAADAAGLDTRVKPEYDRMEGENDRVEDGNDGM